LALLENEGLAYAILFDFGVTAALFSVAIIVLKGKEQKGWWRELLNPPLLAVMLNNAVFTREIKLFVEIM
jgi:predicted permease